jgi:hypothetical protein
MLAIAVLAGLFAVLGVAPAIVIVIGALSTPILLADPGRRIRAAAWVAPFYPLFWLPALYATYFTVWLALGHPPRSSHDQPERLGLMVEIPSKSTWLLLMGMLFSFQIWVGLMLAHGVPDIWSKSRRSRQGAARVLVMTLVYLSAWAAPWAIVTWDLFGARSIWVWFLD